MLQVCRRSLCTRRNDSLQKTRSLQVGLLREVTQAVVTVVRSDHVVLEALCGLHGIDALPRCRK